MWSFHLFFRYYTNYILIIIFFRSDEVNEMITSERNLATNINDCVDNGCDKSCNRQECDLCLPCISGSEYEILEKAHYEHLHKISMKRIFPKPIVSAINSYIYYYY